MTACASLRLAPSLALLVGLAGSLAGCIIDPKSIGIETDDESSGPAESGDTGGSEGSGGTSQGQTGLTNASEPTTAESGDTGDQTCPPIDIPACAVCECIDGEWDCDESGCALDCEGEACGTACMLCPEDDPGCPVPDEGICTADGRCVGVPPPKLGFCEGALRPGFEDELEAAWGCVDIAVFAHDAADERGLVLHALLGLLDQAQAAGAPVHVELPATDPSILLEGRAGFNVTAAECTDAIVEDPDIKEVWLPASGTVIIDVVPGDGDLGTATVQFVDVELRRVQPGPAPIVIDTVWSDVVVGGIPG